jgi:hypothetical protein
MAGVKKINHKGQEILYIDYKGTRDDDEMISILKEAQTVIKEDNKEYFQLTDLREAFATPKYMKAAKEIAKETPKLAKKRAIIGVSSPGKKILLQAYNVILGKNGLKPFDDEEAAKDWLVDSGD